MCGYYYVGIGNVMERSDTNKNKETSKRKSEKKKTKDTVIRQ